MTIYKRNYELEKAANALAPTNQQFNFDNFQNNFSMKHSDIFKLTFKDAHLYKVKEAVLSLLEGWNLVHPNNLLGTVGVMYYEQDSKNVVLELYFYVYNEDGIYATIEPYNFISSIGIEYDYTFEQFHYQNPKNYLYQKMIGNVFIICNIKKLEGINIYGLMATDYKLDNPDEVITTFLGHFSYQNQEYALITLLDAPKGIKSTYGFNSSGWNATELARKIVLNIM